MLRLHITVTSQVAAAVQGFTTQDAENLAEALEAEFSLDSPGLEASATDATVNEHGYSECTIGLIAFEDYNTMALESWIERQDGGYRFHASAGSVVEAHAAFD